MISSGLTRFRVEVMRAPAVTSLDGVGRRTTVFTSAGYMRCDMRESMPSESFVADGVVTVGSMEFRTRWPNIGRLSVTQVDRLRFGGKIYRIAGIRDMDQRRRVAIIDAVEVS
jgi:hypothetical protein